MRRVVVNSTSIRSIGYDARRRQLEVEFRESGDVYRYFDVSSEENAEFMGSESKGTYLNQVFKPKGHEFIAVKKRQRLH
jgi:hypothetical protein